MSKQHRARRNIRGGVATGAVLAAVALTTGAAYAGTAGATPVPPLSCAQAIVAYQHAAAKANKDAVARNKAQRAYDQAKAILAKYDSTHGGTGQPPVVDADRAKLATDVQQTSDALKAAQDTYTADAGAASNAKAAADTACTGPAGTVVAKFNTCAEVHAAGLAVIVSTDPRFGPWLDRDHDGIGCEPADVSAPPQASTAPAPAPQIQETHLPVTH